MHLSTRSRQKIPIKQRQIAWVSHPAAVGGATRCAITRRHLRPENRPPDCFLILLTRSDSASNCARDNCIVPSCTRGHAKLPCSGTLQTITMPVLRHGRSDQRRNHGSPRPGSSADRHAWTGRPPSPRNADQASTRSAPSAPKPDGRTGSLPAALRSGSAVAAQRRSWQSPQRPHQSCRALYRHITRNPKHNL